ncbi:hypothetical protein AB0J42_35430 [Nonomuraea sp. NPDC049649]|uniref:hypothetical protein n=1 Tax=Nonomuraea sp. NPDC049649 TaxID=3155776 RepID=UPI003417C85C
MNDSLQQIARRFPLVARPRPACLPLKARIAEVRDLAYAASQRSAPDHLTLAAQALNKAALIASDCGIPTTARSLCWRHFTAYLSARPLGAREARHALEPLVNLARVAIRVHDGTRGYHLLDTLFHAVSNGNEADIDGHRVSFDAFTRTPDDLRTVLQWLWGVFLAEGTRALISEGRWHRAVAHAEQYRGVGQRLLDGRQAAIVAHCLAGHTDTAASLVVGSTLSQPWEHAVADCLSALCRRVAGCSSDDAFAAVRRYCHDVDRSAELLIFRTRLGLTVIDLDRSQAGYVHSSLIGDVLAMADGYAAREVLAHDQAREMLGAAEEQALASVMKEAGLGQGAIPDPLMADLLTAVELSEAAIGTDLRAPV